MNCLICYDAKTTIKPGDCDHCFCKQCINLYLKDAINNGSVHLITCPACKSEYSALVIKLFCITHYERYLELKQKAIIKCSVCKEDIKKHKCKANVCLKCGEQHEGYCSQRCPNCLIPIEKISGCNHMVCKCKYEFCWLCGGKFTRYHYRLWNLCGCAIPGSMMRDIKPLKYPNLIRYLMVIPKIIMFLLVIALIIISYPFFCFPLTVKFHYRQFKQEKIRILLVLLFPITYLIHLLYYGIFALQKKMLSYR